MMIKSFQDLAVWQKAIDLVDLIYDVTGEFPKEELYGLSSQMRRCAVSIPSNIAEGYLRGTRSDYARFVGIAYGSAGELQTQLIIGHRRKFLTDVVFEASLHQLEEVMRMTGSLYRKLKESPSLIP